jgi:hypothetical protein
MTIAPAKPATVQKITLEQWQERATICKKAVKELIILWFVNNLGTQKQLADYLSLTPQAVSKRKSKLIASGELTCVVMSKTHPKKKDKKSLSPVENSDSGIEEVTVVVDEPAASSTAIEQPSNSIAIERPAGKPQAAPKVKRPKELANMLDTHQKYIMDRLLPIAQKVVALHEEVKVEQERLHKAWTKDNLVFTEPYQRCVDYWNEREMFGEFAKTFGDPTIKTYADVLSVIQVRFRRCSERMETIQYSTGCIADPNKRDMRI